MKNRPLALSALLPAILLLFLINQRAYSADGTWLANPVDNNWYNPANWSSGTVPEGGDTAIFAFSNITDVNILAGAGLREIDFDVTAGAYTITASAGLGIGGDGAIQNNSGVEQNFVATTSEGSAGGFSFLDSSVVGPCTFTQQARNSNTGSVAAVTFEGGGLNASAGSAIFHNLGASVAGGVGGQTNFNYFGATADQCTITNDGATVSGATGGATLFFQAKPSAGNATLIANGGTNGGGGGSFTFFDGSLGGTARLELFGNGYMDMSTHIGPSLSIGSIEGDGPIYLGKTAFMVGSNNLSTVFSGVLHPGSPTAGGGTGSLTKIGTGTLTLSGANLYTAGTTVSAGTLVVSNTTGSATGTGAVQLNAGTLGGNGIISGAVTVGTGSGSGAFLAPAAGTKVQATMTMQSALTFNADATYTYTFKAKKSKARTDKVVANGVTINGGSFGFQGTAQGTLKTGLTMTAISNTAETPISGTFANLPDGAILTVNGNNFQASYEGGDGNDLTLTVVP